MERSLPERQHRQSDNRPQKGTGVLTTTHRQSIIQLVCYLSGGLWIRSRASRIEKN